MVFLNKRYKKFFFQIFFKCELKCCNLYILYVYKRERNNIKIKVRDCINICIGLKNKGLIIIKDFQIYVKIELMDVFLSILFVVYYFRL